MERLPLTVVAALALLGPGCSASKFWKTDNGWTVPEGVPTTPTGSGMIQAGATTPAPPAASSSFSLPGMGKPVKEKKVPAVEMAVLWRNKVDFLPDPSRNGQMGPGLVGQLFLFGPRMEFAQAEGKLTVALYDETPRPPGAPQPKPMGWEFTKDVLQRLRTPDERFGMSYALFLPWQDYRPDVTKVRIAIRFDPEQGFPLYAPETRLSLDTGKIVDGATSWTNAPLTPGGTQPAVGFSPIGGPPPGTVTGAAAPGATGMGVMVTGGAQPAGGFVPQPGGVVPAGGPMPVSPALLGPAPPGSMSGAIPVAPPGYGAIPPAPGPSPARPASEADLAGLPPLAFTVQRPQGR